MGGVRLSPKERAKQIKELREVLKLAKERGNKEAYQHARMGLENMGIAI